VEAADSIPGHPLSAVDPRTGVPLRLAVQKILASGSLDQSWEPDSTQPVAAALANLPRSIRTADGGAFSVWTDERSQGGLVRLLRLTTAGLPSEGWPLRGAIIHEGEGSHFAPVAAGDCAGGAYVAWTDFRSGTARIYLQRIAGDGTLVPAWPPDAVLVAESPGSQSNSRLLADAEGVTVLWEDYNEGPTRVRVKRFDADGEAALGWNDPDGAILDTLGISAQSVEVLSISELGSGVLWQRRSAQGGVDLVLAFAPQAQGLASLPVSPTIVASGADAFGNATVIEQGEESVTLIWSEWREGTISLRAQNFRLPGLEPTWTPGGVMIREGEVSRAPPAAVALNDSTIAVAVQAMGSSNQSDVIVHALGPQGAPPEGWNSNGAAACFARGDQYRPAIARDAVGNLLVSWLDSRQGTSSPTIAQGLVSRPAFQLVRATATPGRARILWRATTTIGAPIPVERRMPGAEWERIAVAAPDDSARLAVDDQTVQEGMRAEYRLSLKTARSEIHSGVVALDIPTAPKVLTLHRVSSLGREQALLVAFALPRGEAPRLDLLDVQGRRMFEQTLGNLEPGEQQVRWRLPLRVASGVYFLRLIQGRETRTAKVPFIR